MIPPTDPRYFIYTHLKSYQSSSHEEEKTRQEFIKFVETNPKCFDRENGVGHITGSALLLSPDKSEVLLTHHKKIGLWLQLGGHSDGEHNTFEVGVRETVEESGITDLSFLYPYTGIFGLDIQQIPKFKDIPAHLHYDLWILLVANTKEFKISSESTELKWVKFEDVSQYNNQPAFIHLVEKARKIVSNNK